MKSKKPRVLLFLFITIGLVGAFVYYLYLNADRYLELLNLSVPSVIALSVLSLLFPIFNGMQNTYLYRSLGVEGFSHWDGILLTSASTLANQLPIPAGIVSKGFYLKKRHNLSYTKFTSSTIALFFCYLTVNGMIGIGVLLYWVLFRIGNTSPVLFGGFAGMVSCILIFWLPLEHIKIQKKICGQVNQAIKGWIVISRNPDLLAKIISLQIILVFLLALRYWLAFHMLSQSVTISQAILFASASILTQLVSIAPGGLGVREIVVGATATTIGFDIGISVVAVGLDRLIVTLTIMLTGWISTIILGKQISETSVKVVDE